MTGTKETNFYLAFQIIIPDTVRQFPEGNTANYNQQFFLAVSEIKAVLKELGIGYQSTNTGFQKPGSVFRERITIENDEKSVIQLMRFLSKDPRMICYSDSDKMKKLDDEYRATFSYPFYNHSANGTLSHTIDDEKMVSDIANTIQFSEFVEKINTEIGRYESGMSSRTSPEREKVIRVIRDEINNLNGTKNNNHQKMIALIQIIKACASHTESTHSEGFFSRVTTSKLSVILSEILEWLPKNQFDVVSIQENKALLDKLSGKEEPLPDKQQPKQRRYFH